MHAQNNRQRNTERCKNSTVLWQMAILACGRNARTCVRGILAIESLDSRTGSFKDSENGFRATSNEALLPRVVNNQHQLLDLVFGFPYSRWMTLSFYVSKYVAFSLNYRSSYYRKIGLLLSCLDNYIRSILYHHPSLPPLSFSSSKSTDPCIDTHKHMEAQFSGLCLPFNIPCACFLLDSPPPLWLYL